MCTLFFILSSTSTKKKHKLKFYRAMRIVYFIIIQDTSYKRLTSYETLVIFFLCNILY